MHRLIALLSVAVIGAAAPARAWCEAACLAPTESKQHCPAHESPSDIATISASSIDDCPILESARPTLQARLDLQAVAAGTYAPVTSYPHASHAIVCSTPQRRPTSSSAVLHFESDSHLSSSPVAANLSGSSNSDRGEVYVSGFTSYVRKGLAAGGAVTAFTGWPQAASAQPGQPRSQETLRGTAFDLAIGETLMNFTGSPKVALTINGSVPGPLLRWREGDTVTLRVPTIWTTTPPSTGTASSCPPTWTACRA